MGLIKDIFKGIKGLIRWIVLYVVLTVSTIYLKIMFVRKLYKVRKLANAMSDKNREAHIDSNDEIY